MITKDELVALAVQAANAHQLDPALVCAVCEQESSWNPFAIRFEDAFYMRYVKPQNLPSLTETMSRSFSWGLMQVMGEVAREFGFKGEYLSMLTDPAANLDVGCRVLGSKLSSHPSSVESALLAWNGGANQKYGEEVIARMPRYA